MRVQRVDSEVNFDFELGRLVELQAKTNVPVLYHTFEIDETEEYITHRSFTIKDSWLLTETKYRITYMEIR